MANGFVLHPKASMYDGGTISGSGTKLSQDAQRIQDLVDFAKAQEARFYAEFGCNSYEQFQQLMKDLINEVQQDKKCLENFHNANIKNILAQYMGKTGLALAPTEVIATLTTEGIQIPFNIKQSANAGFFKITITGEGQIKIGMKPNASNLKRLVNDISRDFQKEQKARQFRPGQTKYENQISTQLKSAIESQMGKNGGEALYTLDMTGVGGSTETIGFFDSGVEYNPFQMSAKQLKEWKKEDPAQYQAAIDKMGPEIKNIILTKVMTGASPELLQVFEKTWNRVDVASLFSTGNNLYAGIVGSMGEFGTGLWFDYISLKLKSKGIKSSRVEFLGQLLDKTSGRQGAVDLAFLNNIGVQVKNINTIAHETISTSRPLSAIPDESFQKYMANASFNTGIPYNETGAINYVKDHAEDFLNLALTKSNYGAQTSGVSFYAVGPHFVPASAVFASVVQALVETNVSIGGMGEGVYHGDGDQREGHPMKAIANQHAHPAHQPPTGPESFTPGSALSGDYQSLLHSITVKIEINMHSIISSGSYNVFG